jgi:PAS domain S-box-containing protein
MHAQSASVDGLLDAMPQSIAMLDSEGRITRVNRAWRGIASQHGSLHLGTSYLDVCDRSRGEAEADAKVVATGLRRVLRGESREFSHEYACAIPMVGTRWFTVQAIAVEDGATSDRVMVTHTDVTDLLRARHEAEAGQTTLSLLVEAVTDKGIFLLDAQGRVQSWNQGAALLTGYSADDAVGRGFEFLYSPELIEAGLAAKHLSQARRSRSCVIECDLTRRDGTSFLASMALYLVLTRSGERGFAAVMRNETARRQSEASLQNALNGLEVRNREMEQFVYTVSHDLKTPLVTMAGFLGHVKTDLQHGRSERLPQFISRIDAAAERMKHTIDDLLELSRIGRIAGKTESIDLGSFLPQIATDMAEQASARGATLVCSGEHGCLFADRARLRDAMENLLDNALKYGCPKPGMSVEISSCREGELVTICVRDHGPGISAQAQTKIFGLFQRVDTSQEGTGIGLAIVRRIAEIHGGRAWVESEPGNGAAFYLSIRDPLR